MDILQFVFKFAYILFLSGGLVLSGIYVYMIGYGASRKRTESHRPIGDGYYVVYTSIEGKSSDEVLRKFTARKVFRWSVGLAVLIMITY